MGYINFNYLDQLKETTIDLTDYLTRLSTNNDTSIKFSNLQPVKVTVKNIFQQSSLVSDFKEQGAAFTTHALQDGELPEDVSMNYYETEDYWWIVCLFNGINDPLRDWLLTEEQLQYICNIYTSIEDKYSYKGYYKLLFDWNESRRKIEVMANYQLPDLIFLLRNAMKT